MQVEKYAGIYEYSNESKRHQPQKIVQTLFNGLRHETTMASPCSDPLTGEIATKAASKYDIMEKKMETTM